jgi:hypothetical protein
MKLSSDPTFLLMKLQEMKDYDKRLSFIETNLEKFDASLLKSLDFIVESISVGDSRRYHLAFFRAITLAEVASVYGRVGNIAAAKKFATHCLEAHQKGLYMGGQIGVDCSQETQQLLAALLADAGEFRAFGLEEDAWQAYWMADPIYAAMDTSGESVTSVQLLTAAVILEQVGMLERAEKKRQEALAKTGSAELFRKEKATALKIVGPPPTELPPPDIYDGLTKESALRFNSQTVAVRCIQQTRCPGCRGPMDYRGSTSFLYKNGYYRRCELICKNDATHPPLTLFRNSLLLPDAKIFAGLGSKLDRQEEERLNKASQSVSGATLAATKVNHRPISKPAHNVDRRNLQAAELPLAGSSVEGDTTRLLASYLMEISPAERAKILDPYKEYFKPRWPKPRALFISTSIFLIMCVWISVVPALACYLLLRWSGFPSPFLRVLFGCAAGLVIFHLFLLLARKSALQSFIRRVDLLSMAERSAKVSRPRLGVVTLLSPAAGCVSAFLIGGWAAMVAMPLAALNLRVVLKRMNEKPARRDKGRSKG